MNNNNPNGIMLQPIQKNVNLKVLYTFDDKNTFLARTNNPIQAKIITLPNQPPHNGIQIGCIELKKCLDLLQSISPEWFQKGMDYSIYYKDIIEFDEPYVGSGLYSKILNDSNSVSLVTGRLSTNFINIFQGSNSSSDTLDIKLKLSPIHSTNINRNNNNNSNNSNNNSIISNNNKRKQIDSYPIYMENIANSSSPNSNLDENNQLQSQQSSQQPMKKRVRRSNNTQSNKANNIPQLASRTQSLPFITEDSLAHRIRISDMITSKLDEEIDASGEPISSRFSNFPKNNKNGLYNNNSSQPTKARKTKSFIQSVVKIGDNAVNAKNKKTNSLASVSEHSSKKCVNCLSVSAPPYKFFKDGIFQLANSGYLCSICSSYQSKNDNKSLRERGELGMKGLLDVPYINKNTNSKRVKKKRSVTNSSSHSNPNSSIIENSSSPLISNSSPVMNLQNGFISKSKKQITNTNLSSNNNSNSSNNSNNNKPIYETIHEIENFKNEDLMALLKLESTFANYKTMPNLSNNNNNSNNVSDPIEDIFRIPENKFQTNLANTSSSASSSTKGQQSKSNTPNENSEGYYRDFDNIPLDATKLNTTLIPIDDDDKENYPPSNMPPPSTNIYNHNNNRIKNNHLDNIKENEKDHIHNLFGANDFSPSIQRIIESFSNEPSSPTKTTTNEWNYNFFEEDVGFSENDSNGNGNQHTECDDPEIDRILSQNNDSNKKTDSNKPDNENEDEDDKVNTNKNINNVNKMNFNNIDKYEITPRDPGTAQTQQNEDSPNGLRMTPGNSAFELQMSSSSKAKIISNNNSNKNEDDEDDEKMNRTIKDGVIHNDNKNNNKDNNDINNNINNNKNINKNISTSSAGMRKSRLTMPSSPFFHIHNDEEITKDDKSLDTTESLINWDAKSSPVTDPLSSSYEKQ